MARRKKKGEPEMLIVSFCDIVTITTAAMFFAMLITVQEAVKIPVFRPTPKAVPSNKKAVFFECRSNEVFYVDKAGLDERVAKLLSTVNTGVRGGDMSQFLKVLQGQEVTNQYYRVNPGYLLTAIMALDARPGVHGDTVEHLEGTNSVFHTALAKLDPQDQYIAFLVRDDSFTVFRKARMVADRQNFDIGWELLGGEEPIKFGAGGVAIPTM
jgi:biopolymer transport protein ExbD